MIARHKVFVLVISIFYQGENIEHFQPYERHEHYNLTYCLDHRNIMRDRYKGYLGLIDCFDLEIWK